MNTANNPNNPASKPTPNAAPNPAPNPATDMFPAEWLTSSGPKAKAINEWLKANNPPDLATLMDLYKILVFQFMRDNGAAEDCIRQITPMLRTIASYEQHLVRQDHRERSLKLKEAKHERELARAAKAKAAREEAEAFAANQPTQAEHIAEMRKLYFKDVEIFKEYYDIILPDEKNPIGRVQQKIPGFDPLGMKSSHREPVLNTGFPPPQATPVAVPIPANPGVINPIHTPAAPPVWFPIGSAVRRRGRRSIDVC